MIKVSTAELKARLGTYLGMVRAGATIDITSYHQSVARLVPAVEQEPLIEEPTGPAEALAQLTRLPSTVVGTLDAIHLTSALAVHERGNRHIDEFLTHDGQLATAARAMGFAVRGVAEDDDTPAPMG